MAFAINDIQLHARCGQVPYFHPSLDPVHPLKNKNLIPCARGFRQPVVLVWLVAITSSRVCLFWAKRDGNYRPSVFYSSQTSVSRHCRTYPWRFYGCLRTTVSLVSSTVWNKLNDMCYTVCWLCPTWGRSPWRDRVVACGLLEAVLTIVHRARLYSVIAIDCTADTFPWVPWSWWVRVDLVCGKVWSGGDTHQVHHRNNVPSDFVLRVASNARQTRRYCETKTVDEINSV